MGIGISIAVVSIALCVGLIVELRRRGKQESLSVRPVIMSREAQAQKAFVQGNTCLFNGEVAEAIAFFQRALDLDPNHPHAAKRLREAEQRQAEEPNELVRIAS